MENEVPTSYKVANEASTAFKNFRGIDSWANFVTAKETPLMEQEFGQKLEWVTYYYLIYYIIVFLPDNIKLQHPFLGNL